MMFSPRPGLALIVLSLLGMGSGIPDLAAAPARVFRAGADAMDITPKQLPVIVNGGFREATSSTVFDRLHSRSLVLDDGQERLALVVVDSCMVPRDLLDAAKAIASTETGIRMDRMLISSTHTHSAPAAMGCLGSGADPNYVKALPGMIAAGIVRANARLQAARIGWTSIDAPDHTNCRRWILRPDQMRTDPFGEKTVRAHMHPGHQNPSFIGPSGPVDTGLSLLAVQTAAGRPLAMFANYSMHYYGASALSADYCGAFPEEFARLIKAGDGKSRFVAAMSQGTSGDLQWMDYSKPRPERDIRKYSAELAEIAQRAYESIEYRPWVSLAMAEARLKLRRRVADAARLEWAGKIAATLTKRKPVTQQEIYAREQVLIAADPERELILQAARIGELGITALPNEVYSITGLKLKALSPLRSTFNIELANGAEGYIPPPEQHHLGGYTTWAARTAALETNAEPKIVETLLGLLEQVAEKPRRPFVESPGAYAQAVLADQPHAYWRLGELAGTRVADASGKDRHAALEYGFALHLEGPPGTGFSAAGAINRAVQFAGGKLDTGLAGLPEQHTVEFWFWNGLPAGVRATNGVLCSRGTETLALVRRDKSDETVLRLTAAGHQPAGLLGKTAVPVKTWHHVAVVRGADFVTVWLDGKEELRSAVQPVRVNEGTLFIGGDAANTANFEGRIDEVAVYDRALSAAAIQRHVEVSGIGAWRAEQRLVAAKELAARIGRIAGPRWSEGYHESIRALKPMLHWSFDQQGTGAPIDVSVRQLAGFVEPGVEMRAQHPAAFPESAAVGANFGAWFRGGRIKANAKPLPLDYSVSVWFRNDQPNDSRAVTGYIFSRGPDGDRLCPGDHLGIGGTYRGDLTGKLMVFNGNRLDQVVAGKTTIQPGTWNHVVMVRQGARIRAWLNGGSKPEIDTELPVSITAEEAHVFFGGRNDKFSNLNGYLDEAVVFDRALTGAEARTLHQASGVKAPTAPTAPEPPAVTPLESEALPPAAALAAIKVRDGFTVELVAAEPLVKDPVAIDWGADGRLWVVEMADYPNGMDDNGKPGGRVRVLTDTNGDGQYDQSLLFVDGLNFPSGVMAWKRGVLVTAAPEILYLEDSDGDGKADVKKVMYAGFFEGNQQLRVNGLRWGLDNWIYCASGSHRAGYGGKVMIRSHNGQAYEVGSYDFKIRQFRTKTAEPQPKMRINHGKHRRHERNAGTHIVKVNSFRNSAPSVVGIRIQFSCRVRNFLSITGGGTSFTLG